MSGLDASPPRPSRLKVRMSYCLVTVISRAGKTLISRINLLPPAPAAPYGLASYAICAQFPPQLSQTRKPSPNTTGHKVMPASAGSIPDPHLPPDGRAGLYTYITIRKSWPDFLLGPSELPLSLRLINIQMFYISMLIDSGFSFDLWPLSASMRKYFMCTWYSLRSRLHMLR